MVPATLWTPPRPSLRHFGQVIAILGLGCLLSSAAGGDPVPGTALMRELGCGGCHPGIPRRAEGEQPAPDLSSAGLRFSSAYLFDYLQRPVPVREEIGAARMPDFGFDAEESLSLTFFLESLRSMPDDRPGIASEASKTSTARLAESYRAARERISTATVARGRRIFEAQNCAGCHPVEGFEAKSRAPDLRHEVARVRLDWLDSYLRRPHAVRPAGSPSGSGARMPDFRLDESEIATLLEGLKALGRDQRLAEDSGWNTPLSAFARAKAERLIQEKLDCLGCHRLAGKGGRMAPDLSSLKRRLRPEWARDFLGNPQAHRPDTIMPRRHWPPGQLDLVARYLLQNEAPAQPPEYVRIDSGFAVVSDAADEPEKSGRRLYQKFCASCHGAGGRGDGFNSPYLPVPPTRHADAALMGARSDDTLFDGIHAGGAILGKSHRMPAWRHRLTRSEIRELVSYIRQLCQCEGPAWSSDQGSGALK